MDITAFIANELMESSSSSDEDEELIIKLLNRNPHSRGKCFVENVIHIYSDTEFKMNLRVSRDSVIYLMERYSQSHLKRNYQGGRLQTSVETQILAFLWFSGNKTTFREVSDLFDMSLSNVHASFNRVLNFLVHEIAPEVVKFPRTNEEKEIVTNEFEKISGIPHILGCIGRTYIAARTLRNISCSTYANKHDVVSITLQGICDSKLKFLDVFTGIPSNISDSEVLKLSMIGKELPNLCSDKYYLLGDASYPLREFLLTPYRDYGNLNESEKNFNIHFCRARVKIENAFCLLKSRFRQLMHIDFRNIETMEKFVTACCVLHNICIDRNDCFVDEISNTEISDSNFVESVESDRRDILLTELGQIKRDEVKNLVLN